MFLGFPHESLISLMGWGKMEEDIVDYLKQEGEFL
jgi:hypothetical protein